MRNPSCYQISAKMAAHRLSPSMGQVWDGIHLSCEDLCPPPFASSAGFWLCYLWCSAWKVMWRDFNFILREALATHRRKAWVLETSALTCYRDTCSSMSTVALFTIAEFQNQPRHPRMEEWIKKMWCAVQWNPFRIKKRIKLRFHHLQENGWNWRCVVGGVRKKWLVWLAPGLATTFPL